MPADLTPEAALREVESALRNAYGDVSDVWPHFGVLRAALRAPVRSAVSPELREWADRFAITGVEWLHEVNHHINHEANAPKPPDNSWLAMEGCQHTDCVMGRRFRAALRAPVRSEAAAYAEGFERGLAHGGIDIAARAEGLPGPLDVERRQLADNLIDAVEEALQSESLPGNIHGRLQVAYDDVVEEANR